MYLVALACGCIAAADAGSISVQGVKQRWTLETAEPEATYLAPLTHDPLTPGEMGDDGTKDGLFGQYFDVPFLSSVDGQKVATVKMQMAITPDEDHHGLMFRKTMPENNGMIFLYQGTQQRVLYMRNTYINLDVGWMSPDGTVLEVQQLDKLTETWRWSANSNVQYGLEMNVNWFEKHGVEAGKVHLDMNALANAIAARGFDPSKYGLHIHADKAADKETSQMDKYISGNTGSLAFLARPDP